MGGAHEHGTAALAAKQGIFAGVSSGGAIAAALQSQGSEQCCNRHHCL